MIFITRHPALLELAKERNWVPEDTVAITHVDNPDILSGQIVWGVLPHNLSCRCFKYIEIPLNLSPEERGKELPIERLREVAGNPVAYSVEILEYYE